VKGRPALLALAVLLALNVNAGPAAAAAPVVRAEEMALTRTSGGGLAVFDDVALSRPGVVTWPLLPGAARLRVRGGTLLARRGDTAVVRATSSFSLTYLLPRVGETYLLRRSFPYAVPDFIVFTGKGVVGSGQALPAPRAAAPVTLGGLRVIAYTFGPMPKGSRLAWSLLTGDLGRRLGSLAEDLALLALVAGLAVAWRLLREGAA
jgi:hypothetical protein